MTGYTALMVCAACGERLRHVNGAVSCSTQAIAIAVCGGCERKWEITVLVRPHRTSRNGCGTSAGYYAHRRGGQEPCAACRDAHRAWEAHRRMVDA